MEPETPLSRCRQQRGWPQAALAARCGVSRAEVSGIETGRLVPSVLVGMRRAETPSPGAVKLEGYRLAQVPSVCPESR